MIRQRFNNAVLALRQRFNNAAFTGGSGTAGGGGDRGTGQFISTTSGNPYFFSSYVNRWREYINLYQTSWEARKIINIIPEDAFRKDWILENIPEEMQKKFTSRFKDLNVPWILQKSLIMERLLGGSITFLGLESEKDEPQKPYSPDEGKKLHFLNSIPVSRISRAEWDHNPTSIHFMRPFSYLINGQSMHVSRMLVWDGDPIFDPNDALLTSYRPNLAGFGPSKIAPIWDDIVKAVGSRQAAFQLIQTNNAHVVAINGLQDLLGTTPGKAKLQAVKDFVNQMSVYRAAIIDGEDVKVTNKPAHFGSIPELLMMYMQMLSAASDIPATRFLGQAPGGLNATGESDLENYYNVLDSLQTRKIEPKIRYLCDVVGYDEFGGRWRTERENLTVKFPPLWNPSELETAQYKAVQLDNIIKAYEQGFSPLEKVIEEMNAKEIFSVELNPDEAEVVGDLGQTAEEGGVDPREEIKKLQGGDNGQSTS